MLLKKLSFQCHRHALLFGLSLIITLMVLTSVVAIMQLEKYSEESIITAIEHSENNKLLTAMSQAALKRSITLFEIINTDDPFIADDLFMQLNELATKFTIARQALSNKKLDPKIKVLFDEQTKLAKEIAPMQDHVYKLIQDGEKSKATEYFFNNTLPRSKIFLNTINNMIVVESLNTHNIFSKSKENNDTVLYSIIIFDITSILISLLLTLYIVKKQRENDHELALLARTDILTKLPNRSDLINNIEQAISNNSTSSFTVIFFDIDYFKSINDNYGHEIGDKILQNYASKIKLLIEKGDFFARLGGDEFVLILHSITAPQKVHNFIRKLSQNLDTTFTLNKTEIFTTTSIGACIYPQDGNDTKTLLKHADIAMYTAKKSGRNSFKFFSEESNAQMQKEHKMSHALHTILNSDNTHDELRLVYQPLMNIADGDFTECEALLRWTNSKGENIPADEFIELAEKTNLIEKINLFVIDEACKQQFEWQQAGNKNTRININLSGNKAIFDRLLYQLMINLKVYELSPSLIGIELTERTLFEISEETITELDKLRELGVKISMDDFGTGYSSLSYLKKLPITTLKIDKAFIAGIPDDKDDIILVTTIIRMAQSLNLEIVAEGVETAEQLEFLKEHACNIAQGYYFHRPLESNQISELQYAA